MPGPRAIDDELAALLALDETDDATPETAARAREFREVLGLLPLAETPLVATTAMRDRLLASLDPATPYEGFVRRVGELFDLSAEKVRAIFRDLADATKWEPTLLDRVSTFHLDGGPRAATADCGITRFGAGTVFPSHRHVGREVMILLSGAIRFDDGRVARVGDRIEMADGTRHAFTVLDEDVVAANLLEGHIEL